MSAAATALQVGDFGVRLANTTGDDSPAVFARMLLDPAQFQNDIISTYAPVYGWGTLVHWGPALLLRAWNIAPEASALGIVYLQHMLLAVAIWQLGRVAGASSAVAWASAVFGLAAEVYVWNLASFRSQMTIPYGAHLVLPSLLFATSAVLRERYARAGILLGVSLLIHATTALLSLPPLAAAVHRPGRWRHYALLLGPPLAMLGVLQWRLHSVAPAAMPASEHLSVMRANVHMNPFVTEHFWTILLPTAATLVVLFALSASRTSQWHRAYVRVLGIAVICTVGYAIAQVAAVRFGGRAVLTLIPLRYMSVLVLTGLPLVVGTLVQATRSGDLPQRWAASALLVLHPLSTLGAYWPALVALVLAGFGRTRALRLALLVLWLVAAATLAASGAVPAAGIMTYGARIAPLFLVCGLALAGVTAAARPRSRLSATTILLVLLPVLLLGRSAAKGLEVKGGAVRALYEAQLWARRNTPEQAVFIVEPNVPWRVISQRAAVQVWPADAYVYSRSRAALYHSRAVRAQYAQAPFRTSADVLNFRARFGGDYLVREAGRPALFRPVYRNDEYIVYPLPRMVQRSELTR